MRCIIELLAVTVFACAITNCACNKRLPPEKPKKKPCDCNYKRYYGY